MRLDPDPWLGGLFGCAVYRAHWSTKAPSPEALRRVVGEGTAFVYAKLPVREVEGVGQLTGLGFKVVDINISFEGPPAGPPPKGPAVRRAEAGDRDGVLAIAESCFEYSRFHLDPLVAPGLADRIKRAWVESYFDKKRGDLLLVAELDGRPAGFLAGLVAPVGGRPGWVIDLMGVDRGAQRRGVGASLVRWFSHLACGQAEVMGVGTQVANTPSMGLYASCGFRPAGAAYVLHAHLREGKAR
ncbi:MAG: GNAT family N-acetyltransferase [Candidatus Handelsmanbacteria bacterium]|nr:GNAT family N-acetyltransferase [Candidatus Handelsmanbacteria bacterium]